MRTTVEYLIIIGAGLALLLVLLVAQWLTG
jgi:hypothetical protein